MKDHFQLFFLVSLLCFAVVMASCAISDKIQSSAQSIVQSQSSR